ncbi:hypothetical protein IRM68_17940 (plasmid) [Erwinia amylovora]|nr:hypothetical protein IRM68_17940 [Erwinia amylovora]
MIEDNTYRLTRLALSTFNSTADHRLAEILMGQLYDRIPASVWTYVR